MARNAGPQDWELLGLAPGASLEEVRAAYARRKELYGPDALASYSLHDEPEREALLERLDDAYRAIVGGFGGGTVARAQALAPPTPVEAPADPAPPPDQHPGAFLRHHRVVRQVATGRLAAETKIRASMLELLQSESFHALPAPVYVRGFVVQCARALKLEDPEGIAEAYVAKMRATLGESP